MTLQAPFPWFGGKSRAAPLVWAALGDVVHYVEPFAGSLAVLLQRPPGWRGVETVNDKDGFVANVWRAMQAAPDEVARWADWPPNEADMHARHAWLVAQRADLLARLEGDPAYYDARIAGWWLWGVALWIGSGWCSGRGPWRVIDGRLQRAADGDVGVHRQVLHVGNLGRGVHRKVLHVSNLGRGVHAHWLASEGERRAALEAWFRALAARLRSVRVACGDWTRICTSAVLFGPARRGTIGVFLDPPYGADRETGLYAHDDVTIQEAVWEWACAQGPHPAVRIVVAGLDDGRAMPPGWRCIPWMGKPGYARDPRNRQRERLWLSPGCRPIPRPTPSADLLSASVEEEPVGWSSR